MNNVLEIIKTRRSIRAYTSNPVEREKLQAVLEAGCHAPYGLTLKNRLFTALQGEKRISQVNACIRDCLLSIPVTAQTHPYIQSLIQKA